MADEHTVQAYRDILILTFCGPLKYQVTKWKTRSSRY